MSDETSELDRFKERFDRLERKHRDQLDAKQKEISMLEQRVKDAQVKLAAFDPLQEEVKSLRTRVQRSERVETMRGLGIPADALDDIAAIYQSRMSTVEENERQTWDQFLGDDGMARKIVLLERYFTEPSPGAAPVEPQVSSSRPVEPASSPSPLPNGNAGVAPFAGSTKKLSANELQQYVRSREFKNMSREQRNEFMRGQGSRWAQNQKSPSEGA